MSIKEQEGQKIVELGTGDILVVNIRYPSNPKMVGVGFCNVAPMPIGSFKRGKEGESEQEAGVEVKLNFTSPDSIQVVIDRLREAKETLLIGKME